MPRKFYANITETGIGQSFRLDYVGRKERERPSPQMKVKFGFPPETDLMFTRRRYNLFMIGSVDIYTVSIDYGSTHICLLYQSYHFKTVLFFIDIYSIKWC